MSYTTITQSTQDEALLERLRAAIAKEAWNNPTFGDTPTGEAIKTSWPNMAIEGQFVWPCCLDFEAAYESAVIAENPNPGGDPAVITDAAIGSAVQAHWPDDVA